MQKTYKTIESVLASPLGQESCGVRPQMTDRVLRSTRLEDSIYDDLRTEDEDFSEIEAASVQKLSSFPSLARDVFQSFYSLMPRRTPPEQLSVKAQKFNARILEWVEGSEDYAAIKAICEGKELPSYEAASEFTGRIAGELDGLLQELVGKPGSIDTLDRLHQAAQQSKEELCSLLTRLKKRASPDPVLEKAILDAANHAVSKQRQAEAVSKLIDTARVQSGEAVSAAVQAALSSAAEKAAEVQSIFAAWGDDPCSMERSEANTALLKLVRQSETLRQISRYLGRFRELLAQRRKTGYTYGRGETYSLELGNNISRAITSELAMLATPETLPLFLRKYRSRQFKQYRRRELVCKGMGDIICCLDESGSTCGDAAVWGKAVALALLDMAEHDGRSFALIHFSGPGQIRTDIFEPGTHKTADKISAAETFLGGGTDFQSPLWEAVRLMQDEGFENADVVFLTDGCCVLSGSVENELKQIQEQLHFSITGILLDSDYPGMDFSLTPFCQSIYRTSELLKDEIIEAVIGERM